MLESEKKSIWFRDEKNQRTNLQVGDIVIGNTGLKTDFYRKNDPQVISGRKKAGDPKDRIGLFLDIINKNKVVVIWASNSGGKPFFAKNLNENKEYVFRSSLIQVANLNKKYKKNKKNKLLAKGLPNQQLNNPDLVVEEITASQQYSKFLAKNQKIEKKDPEPEMKF